MVQVLKDPMGTKGARVTTEITLPGRFLVLMPFSEFVGVSRKIDDEERDRLHDAIVPLVPPGQGVIVRTVAAGVREKDLVSDMEFLLRLWKRVSHQAREGLAPEVIYTEMDLALRLVRDVFSDEFKRLIIDDKSLYEKVTSFLKRDLTASHAAGLALQGQDPALRLIRRRRRRSSPRSPRRVDLPSGGHIRSTRPRRSSPST